MEDSKIIELLLSRNEDGIKQIDDTYGRRLLPWQTTLCATIRMRKKVSVIPT